MNRLNNNDYRNLNESIRRMNEQGLPGGLGPHYWNDPPCRGCYWKKGVGWLRPDGTPVGGPFNYTPWPVDPNNQPGEGDPPNDWELPDPPTSPPGGESQPPEAPSAYTY